VNGAPWLGRDPSAGFSSSAVGWGSRSCGPDEATLTASYPSGVPVLTRAAL